MRPCEQSRVLWNSNFFLLFIPFQCSAHAHEVSYTLGYMLAITTRIETAYIYITQYGSTVYIYRDCYGLSALGPYLKGGGHAKIRLFFYFTFKFY